MIISEHKILRRLALNGAMYPVDKQTYLNSGAGHVRLIYCFKEFIVINKGQSLSLHGPHAVIVFQDCVKIESTSLIT